MINILETGDLNNLRQLLDNDQLFIVKNFLDAAACKNVTKTLHHFSKKTKPFLGDIFKDTFYQIDVLPSKTKTERIFRSFHFGRENASPAYNTVKPIFEKLEEFQKRHIVLDKNIPTNFKRSWQIIHYPRGGGFFDWHEHPRYPMNYGLILNLSEKKIDFNSGQTEFKVGSDIVKIDEFADIGDLILFPYDLVHRVAPCDPDEDLVFSSGVRWTAIVPILEFS